MIVEQAELRGREIVVEDDDPGVVRHDGGLDLFDLAHADERRGIGLGPALDHRLHDARAGGAGELLKLFDTGLKIERGGGHGGDVVESRFFVVTSAQSSRSAGEHGGGGELLAVVAGELHGDENCPVAIVGGVALFVVGARAVGRLILQSAPTRSLAAGAGWLRKGAQRPAYSATPTGVAA